MSIRSVFRLLGWFFLMLWLFVTIHLVYRYIGFVSHDSNTKTGTFVEGVSEDQAISYLPYTSFSESNRFYQTFLFDACLDYYFDEDGKLYYTEDLCSVESDDEKTYTVTVHTGMQWSDGTQITIQDVFYTYRRLLVDNLWERSDLTLFNDVSVTLGTGELKVSFPEASRGNRMFFTHFIMPASLGQVTYEEYIKEFTSYPVWSDCASLVPQTDDDDSLVFDLSECDDTYLLRYQIKLLPQSPHIDVSSLRSDFYDLLVLGKSVSPSLLIDGFSRMRVPLREYTMLFFNTQSVRLSAKIQRALGGLIFHNLYTDDTYKDYFNREHLGFDVFLSTGDNVAKYLIAKNPSISLDKYDLEKIHITSLPQKLSLDSHNDFQVYFLEEVHGYKTIEVSLDDTYSAIRVIHNDGEPYIPKTYDSATGKFFYSLSVYNKNLVEGRNSYVVQVSRDGTWKDVGKFEVYYLTSPLDDGDDSIADEDKLQIVYYTDEVSSWIVERLRKVFDAAGISKYFIRYGFDDKNQFQGKILSSDYDLVIGTVDIGLREGLSALFGAKSALVNPSLYNQESFVSLLPSMDTDNNARETVMRIYSTDVPFIVIGQLFDMQFVRSPLLSYLPVDVRGIYHFKRTLYNNVSFGVQKSFVWSDVFSGVNLINFFDQL